MTPTATAPDTGRTLKWRWADPLDPLEGGDLLAGEHTDIGSVVDRIMDVAVPQRPGWFSIRLAAAARSVLHAMAEAGIALSALDPIQRAALVAGSTLHFCPALLSFGEFDRGFFIAKSTDREVAKWPIERLFGQARPLSDAQEDILTLEGQQAVLSEIYRDARRDPRLFHIYIVGLVSPGEAGLSVLTGLGEMGQAEVVRKDSAGTVEEAAKLVAGLRRRSVRPSAIGIAGPGLLASDPSPAATGDTSAVLAALDAHLLALSRQPNKRPGDFFVPTSASVAVGRLAVAALATPARTIVDDSTGSLGAAEMTEHLRVLSLVPPSPSGPKGDAYGAEVFTADALSKGGDRTPVAMGIGGWVPKMAGSDNLRTIYVRRGGSMAAASRQPDGTIVTVFAHVDSGVFVAEVDDPAAGRKITFDDLPTDRRLACRVLADVRLLLGEEDTFLMADQIAGAFVPIGEDVAPAAWMALLGGNMDDADRSDVMSWAAVDDLIADGPPVDPKEIIEIIDRDGIVAAQDAVYKFRSDYISRRDRLWASFNLAATTTALLLREGRS